MEAVSESVKAAVAERLAQMAMEVMAAPSMRYLMAARVAAEQMAEMLEPLLLALLGLEATDLVTASP